MPEQEKRDTQEPQSAIELIENTLGEQSEAVKLAYQIATEQEIPVVRDFSEIDVSPEQKAFFSKQHIEIYSPIADSIAKEIASLTEPQNYIIESGMFGGKTSLVFLILETLEKKYKLKHLTCINKCMDEDFVTARSLDNKEEHALHYGTEEQNSVILEHIKEENISVLFLDECSFRFGTELEEDREFIKQCNQLGASVILTGLNRECHGLPLEFFTENNKELLDDSYRYECRAFVPGQEEEEPIGTHTTRYILLDGKLILDLGVLPLVVSKEELKPNNEPLAIYVATTEEHTMVHILREYPSLLNVLTKYESMISKQEENKISLKTHP